VCQAATCQEAADDALEQKGGALYRIVAFARNAAHHKSAHILQARHPRVLVSDLVLPSSASLDSDGRIDAELHTLLLQVCAKEGLHAGGGRVSGLRYVSLDRMACDEAAPEPLDRECGAFLPVGPARLVDDFECVTPLPGRQLWLGRM
jgi:hypothetical protein